MILLAAAGKPIENPARMGQWRDHK